MRPLRIWLRVWVVRVLDHVLPPHPSLWEEWR